MMKILALLFVLLNVAYAESCGDPSETSSDKNTSVKPEPPVQPKDSIINVQDVEELEVQLRESLPVQVAVVARGHFSNGCTRHRHHEISRDGNTFNLTLYNSKPRNAFCTEALVPFEMRFSIPVDGLKKGTYHVTSGTVTTSFDLPADH